jgi:hypothetical protein
VKKTYRWDLELNKLVEVSRRDPGPKVYIIPDIQPYLDENMGHRSVYVKSRQHRKLLLKERGLTIK